MSRTFIGGAAGAAARPAGKKNPEKLCKFFKRHVHHRARRALAQWLHRELQEAP